LRELTFVLPCCLLKEESKGDIEFLGAEGLAKVESHLVRLTEHSLASQFKLDRNEKKLTVYVAVLRSLREDLPELLVFDGIPIDLQPSA